MTNERKDVPLNDCWNLALLYPTFEAWEKEFARYEKKQGPRFPELLAYRGTLQNGPAHLADYLQKNMAVGRELTKLYTYAHLKHDEDVANDQNKKAHDQAQKLLADFREETSWDEPELLGFSEEQFQAYIVSPELQEYALYLKKMYRMKPHVLPAEMEEMLAQSAIALGTPYKGFTAFNNGDLKFPVITDSTGKTHELTHGKYQLYLKSPDRVLRENAFKTMHRSFLAYENTLCELLQGQIQTHFFEQRARRYSSCLEAALFPHQIDISVYKNLIKSVRERLPALHKYFALRKRVMGLDQLQLWDLSSPLVAEKEYSVDFDNAIKQVVESVEILGKDYQNILEKGLTKDRWVDRYENARKRSGAYSSGCFDSVPYILMNYHGTFRDVMTLTHEAGHSMHSFLSNRTQPYQYSHYSIFVAEVASTFNEELLMRYLVKKSQSDGEKAFLINQKIDDIRATLFRQTMFAEFELKIHEWVEQGMPLTPTLLKAEFRQLCTDYFGPDVAMDDVIDIEWARIPHFYYDFYVYQYATGISAALALVERLFNEGEPARAAYLQFLSSGNSQFPLDLLAQAGVDMRQPDAVEAAIGYFDRLVDELAHLLKN